MDFLGFYNLFMALALAGACSACDGSGSAFDSPFNYNADSAYVEQGRGDSLPPAYAVINRPLTQIDNGYNPAFYWNQPQEAADDYDDGDNGDRGGYGYQANYPQSAYDAADQAYADAVNGDNTGYYGGYDGGYYAYGGAGYGVDYRRRSVYPPHREHHEHRDTMQRHDNDHAQDMGNRGMNRDAHADDRHTAARGEQYDRVHAARDNPGSGYNGHDGHMFDGAHRPVTPAAAGYQGHDRNDDGRDHPHQ